MEDFFNTAQTMLIFSRQDTVPRSPVAFKGYWAEQNSSLGFREAKGKTTHFGDTDSYLETNRDPFFCSFVFFPPWPTGCTRRKIRASAWTAHRRETNIFGGRSVALARRDPKAWEGYLAPRASGFRGKRRRRPVSFSTVGPTKWLDIDVWFLGFKFLITRFVFVWRSGFEVLVRAFRGVFQQAAAWRL